MSRPALRLLPIRDDGRDLHRVYAVMVFPDDTSLRHSYLAYLVHLGRLPEAEAPDDVDPWTAPNWPTLKQLAGPRVREGFLAGDLLASRAVMDKRGDREPSNRKAARALELFWAKKHWGDGDPMRASNRQIENSLARMKSVAHLWAALVVLRARYGRDGVRAEMRRPRGLRYFLRVAAYMQQFGGGAMTPRTTAKARHPLLEAAGIWGIPVRFSPVKGSELPDFRPEVVEALQAYRHA